MFTQGFRFASVTLTVRPQFLLWAHTDPRDDLRVTPHWFIGAQLINTICDLRSVLTSVWKHLTLSCLICVACPTYILSLFHKCSFRFSLQVFKNNFPLLREKWIITDQILHVNTVMASYLLKRHLADVFIQKTNSNNI